ncbi:hypothetical protein PT974_11839 [Cladobotryum mycophilum]|uniref:Uncharacterized protein n=1 Tax=Cladobotryum mycophilum TaxID=491253 RepID=A0ABR0S7A4_9HYPO
MLLCLGLILGSEKPRPIRWDVWAGKIEREGDAGFVDATGEMDNEFRGSPFSALESRPGFIDIRKLRREFTDWAESHGK